MRDQAIFNQAFNSLRGGGVFLPFYRQFLVAESAAFGHPGNL
jgi:hypothetical protein